MTAFTMGPALLFCPADRPDRYEKAAERADAVILDLEDAVSADAKASARGALIDSHLDPDRVIVRVNPVGTADFAADIATLSQTDYRTIMVAKSESAKRIGKIDARFAVIALCETARGIAAVEKIAAQKNVIAIMWGADDLVASLGGTSSRKPKGGYRDIARYARARALLAAGVNGIAAIDAVHMEIADERGLAREASDAVASGFAATGCIHPDQVAVVRRAYEPDAKTLAWARGVLATAENERGVFAYRGRMVDEPVLRHARTLIQRGAATSQGIG